MAEDILRDKGLAVTSDRLKVLGILAEDGHPLSISDIRKLAGRSVNYVTIYRMLKTFVAKGIIYQTDFRENKAYYEFQGANHHHHIVCTSCGKRETVNVCPEPDEGSILMQAKNFSSIKSHVLEFFGECDRCNIPVPK